MKKLVFVFETMECDWDTDKIVRGIFSDANEAVEHIRNNYFLLDDKRDICIPNYPIKEDVDILNTKTIFTLRGVVLDELLN